MRYDYPSLEGRTVAVSGSTGGLGRELCISLANLGARLILLDRNPEKAARLIEELRLGRPSLWVRHIRMDLEDVESVKKAADELKKEELFALVLNAGAYHIPRHRCESGHDNLYQINCLSPYLLASSLLPRLKECGGRIVAVGSLAHFLARPDREDPEYLDRRTASRVYGNAKRRLMFSLQRLCRDGVTLSVVHPGISPTGITRGYPKWICAIIKCPMKLIFMSPKRASECILRGIFQPTGEGEWIGPRVLGIWGRPKLSRLRSYSADEADGLFSHTENEISRL